METIEQTTDLPVVAQDDLNTVQSAKASTLALVTNDENMRRVTELATTMANAKMTVPKHLQGNVGDCTAVVLQAMTWGMNPFAVAQKTHLVNGTLGYEAQLFNAVIQESGAIHGRFHYDYRGDGMALECRVGAVLRGESEITWGEWLKNGDVKTRNSPLWQTNPKQQLGYLQVKNWARLYCPGAILGVYTPDELMEKPLNDAPARSRSGAKVAEAAANRGTVIDPAQEERRNALIAALEAAASKGSKAFMAAWKDMGKNNKDDAYLVGEPEYMRLLGDAQRADQQPEQPEQQAGAQDEPGSNG